MDVPTGKDAYNSLIKKFELLASKKGFAVNDKVGKKVNGARVLIPREKNEILAVWKQKDDFRICVQDKEVVNWRNYKGYRIGNVISEPSDITLMGAWDDIPKDYWYDYIDNYPWKIKWGEYLVRYLSTKGREGLWLTKRGKEPILVHKGGYREPIVIPGSEWVIATKTGKVWSEPDTLVKINLKTKQEYDLGISPAKGLEPIGYIPEHKRVLFKKTIDYMLFEYYLYDIKTGKTEKVNGNFEPLCQQTYRPLQPTGKNNEYWAAIPAGDQTDFGIYNSKTFKFSKLFSYPDITFNSMDMWVDAESKHVYVAVSNNYDLLELPFIKNK